MDPLPPGTITINNIARDLNTKQPLDSIIARVYIADTLFQTDTTGTNGIFTFTGLLISSKGEKQTIELKPI